MKKILLLIGIFLIIGILTLFGVFMKEKKDNEKSTQQNVSVPPSVSPRNLKPLKIKGSIPYWDQENAFLTFRENADSFDTLHLFWYYAGKQGTVEKYENTNEDKSIIDFAHSKNVKVIPVITNLPEHGSWDKDLIGKILNNSALRKNHIKKIMQKIEEYNFDGIDIDFEQLNKSDKNAYSQFLSELAKEVHAQNKILVVALHPKTAEAKSSETNGAFQDWSAIAQSADHLNIMAYDQHWDTGNAGPVASISWVKDIVMYVARLNVPQEKFYLGIPLDGYDWNKDNEESANGVTYEEISHLIRDNNVNEQWDSRSESPYFFYKSDDQTHEVWYENAKSTKEKMKIAHDAGFGGVTFWRLGGEDPKMWENIKDFK